MCYWDPHDTNRIDAYLKFFRILYYILILIFISCEYLHWGSLYNIVTLALSTFSPSIIFTNFSIKSRICSRSNFCSESRSGFVLVSASSIMLPSQTVRKYLKVKQHLINTLWLARSNGTQEIFEPGIGGFQTVLADPLGVLNEFGAFDGANFRSAFRTSYQIVVEDVECGV